MPKKYHIKVAQTAPRFPAVPKFAAMELDGCLGCLKCVKRDACLYDVYHDRKFVPDDFMDNGEPSCVMCFRCVQECKKGILSRTVNPRFSRLGDAYWTPELIDRIWRQASSGKVPVSGAGYRGPFTGPGFDQMWTDMSEIVRPTRDGIHGREYISTVVDLGRKPATLQFDADGGLVTEMPPFIENPIPVFFDLPAIPLRGGHARKAIAAGAKRSGTLAVASFKEALGELAEDRGHLIVRVDPATDDVTKLEQVRMIELADGDGVMDAFAKIKQVHPGTIVGIRVLLDENAADRALALVQQNAEVIMLQATHQGLGYGSKSDLFVTKLVREVHLKLVQSGVRDQVTLLVSGGVALAEHVAKIIICGADAAGLDLALWVAMECRLCGDCLGQASCPVKIENAPMRTAVQRITNLVGALHSQLIEVMGAMGLREVRRLRGEVGRAMFFEDLERECFAPVFGARSTAENCIGKKAPKPMPPFTEADFDGLTFAKEKSW